MTEKIFNVERKYAGAADHVPRGPELMVRGDVSIREQEGSDETSPLVSVVTVCRNARSTITRALESVSTQTYQNVEHIVIDGLSTDGTLAILESRKSQLSYLLSEPDSGIYNAMNKALRATRGDYIVILNADDYLYPNFIEVSLARLQRSGADITYCDYATEAGEVMCPSINVGLLFSQLDIKHNTFLADRRVYEEIGLFDESYSIVADAKWNRLAYLSGKKFAKIEETLVFYSTAGASSAASEDLKARIIGESKRLLKEFFTFLDDREAEILYLSNFNPYQLDKLLRVFENYSDRKELFQAALKKFVEFNLAVKSSYEVKSHEPHVLGFLLDISDKMGVSLNKIRFLDDDNSLSKTLTTLQYLREQSETHGVVLHFLRRFSAPSEPFIHQLVGDLSEVSETMLHVVLCDDRALEHERAYRFVLHVPWETTDVQLRRRLYRLIWEWLKPTNLVAHFALNAYHLFRRLTPEQRYTPTLIMCHGIDVFSIQGDKEYGKYITEYAAVTPRVMFTAVSLFLCRKLQDAGVPEDRVVYVPNIVGPRFASGDYRKQSGFYRRDRPLEILSVGRLIAWKGHRLLVEALGLLKEELPAGFNLTIVHGGWDEDKPAIEAAAKRAGIGGRVAMRGYVNFDETPEFHKSYDLFVLPSTESDEKQPKTETFGVAVLEAIASGLPVITTDAGGLPETVGMPNPMARIVPHGNVRELAEAIKLAECEYEQTFADNLEYATERLSLFTAERQQAALAEAFRKLNAPKKKIVHFSSLTEGGAAGATLNAHRALLREGYDSHFVTRDDRKISMWTPNVHKLSCELRLDYDVAQIRDQIKGGFTVFSIDDHCVSNETVLSLVKGAKLVNFAWYTQFISTDNISSVAKTGVPVVLTIRDMNPLTGGCHYFHGCTNWMESCRSCPQLKDNPDDFPARVLDNKLRGWDRPNVAFIVLSEHTRRIAESSKVARNKAIHRISNYVDKDRFFPVDPTSTRKRLDLSPEDFVIGYLPSFNSVVKGHSQLVCALNRLKDSDYEGNCAIVYVDGGNRSMEFPFPARRFERLSTFEQLREFYSVADVIVVPSLEETFSNTTIEALACGTPVVGFKTGVLEEVLADPVLGDAVPVGDVAAFAQALRRRSLMLKDSTYVREQVVSRYSEERHVAEFEQLLDRMCALDGAKENGDAQGNSSVSDIATCRDLRAAVGAKRRFSQMRRQNQALEKGASATASSQSSWPLDDWLEYDELRAQLTAMQNSTSWRVTRPIRALRLFFIDRREFRRRLKFWKASRASR